MLRNLMGLALVLALATPALAELSDDQYVSQKRWKRDDELKAALREALRGYTGDQPGDLPVAIHTIGLGRLIEESQAKSPGRSRHPACVLGATAELTLHHQDLLHAKALAHQPPAVVGKGFLGHQVPTLADEADSAAAESLPPLFSSKCHFQTSYTAG